MSSKESKGSGSSTKLNPINVKDSQATNTPAVVCSILLKDLQGSVYLSRSILNHQGSSKDQIYLPMSVIYLPRLSNCKSRIKMGQLLWSMSVLLSRIHKSLKQLPRSVRPYSVIQEGHHTYLRY